MLLLPPVWALLSLRPKRRAFTLVEMLVVIAVMVIIIGVSGPALTALKSAGDVSKAVYDIAGVLEQSRAYAMSNNTYVYVGLNESDVTSSDAARQTSGPANIGRVTLVVIASRDGTSNLAATNLMTVGKVQSFSNLHMVNLGTRPDTGSMARQPTKNDNAIDPKFNVGDVNCVSATPFEYPLGSAAGAGKYTFTKVIQYDPQGVSRIQQNTTDVSITTVIEIGLQQTHGNTAPTLPSPATTGSIAALQIDGVTGSTHIYRP